jgi:hypothetical protein
MLDDSYLEPNRDREADKTRVRASGAGSAEIETRQAVAFRPLEVSSR